ncbi:hypothetical protein SAMN04488062_12041 [Flavobacterium omnivorum]|uniref:DUF7793 domain-containing protein n=1 Tax=Flavobacterium omnivorum TaxID=178355 RepID=A0A1G8H6D3_9FLAO|nr:hypothetical protein [Flavobacterium omnivorum]SDI02217.1 hypothetical protein SAMN04488062_12041 [Flavobacterium omnivorum]
MIDNYHENEFALFWIQNDIFYFEYKPNVVINLKAAQLVVADRILVQNEKAYPVLCDIRGIMDSDKAARDYLAQSGSVLTKAVSLIGNDTVLLSIMSFYITINKPRVPTKFFTEELAALAFLEMYT